MRLCKNCNKEVIKQQNIFCSKSCAATFNNKKRPPRSAESKLKTAISVCNTLGIPHIPKDYNKTKKTDAYLSAIHSNIPFTKVKQCTFCKKWFNFSARQTTTCSDVCYINVKLVLNAGIHKKEYNGVIFDSGWEVAIAKQLDSLKISWIRPTSPLLWIDYSGKSRKYFPDFYLPEYKVFLDPKNPIATQKQLEKVTFIQETYKNVIIGSLDEILLYISQL
jgi:hypothetical protein